MSTLVLPRMRQYGVDDPPGPGSCSTDAVSPDLKKPSGVNASAVASALRQYSLKTFGPRISSSPGAAGWAELADVLTLSDGRTPCWLAPPSVADVALIGVLFAAGCASVLPGRCAVSTVAGLDVSSSPSCNNAGNTICSV